MRLIPHWRKATWVIVLWTLLMAFWIVSGVTAAPNNCAGKVGLELNACQYDAMGGGIGVPLILLLWYVGFVALSLIWLMSRPERRLCPVCGESVKKGLTVCPGCGFNFASALRRPAAAPESKCPRCHKPIAIGQPTCGNCGMTITWGAQPPPP